MAAMRPARRGEKTPPGYTVKYVWPDSDYAETRRKMFVKKAKAKKATPKKKRSKK